MQAIALDPDFRALLTRGSHLFVLRFSIITSRPRIGERKLAPKRKLRFACNRIWQKATSPLGQCIYWMDQDYDRALKQFEIASRLSPSNADTRSADRGD